MSSNRKIMSNLNINQTNSVSTRSGIITSSGTLLPANPNRQSVIIQNLNTANPLFVKFGTSASSSDFDVVLKPGTATDDGLGGVLSFDTLSYTGIITVAGTTVRCTGTDF